VSCWRGVALVFGLLLGSIALEITLIVRAQATAARREGEAHEAGWQAAASGSRPASCPYDRLDHPAERRAWLLAFVEWEIQHKKPKPRPVFP
jgi:ribosome modulation factor